MIATESDPLLRRLERNAVLACGLMAVAALVWRRGDPGLAWAVAAGGLLAWASYRGIKGGIDAGLAGAGMSASGVGWTREWALVKFFTRYAIVALAAYIGMVRLRLHPVGLVMGASSFVAAAIVEAIRSVRAPSRSEHPR